MQTDLMNSDFGDRRLPHGATLRFRQQLMAETYAKIGTPAAVYPFCNGGFFRPEPWMDILFPHVHHAPENHQEIIVLQIRDGLPLTEHHRIENKPIVH